MLSIDCPGIFYSWPNWKGEEGLYLGGHIGLFHFSSIQGYGRPNFKNQYSLERMTVWFINPLELNLTQFDPLEMMITVKKILVSHPENSNCANSPPGKIYIYFRINSWKKIIIKRPLRFLYPYPSTDKNWNNPLWALRTTWLS